jgi:hypothetical protein
MPVAVVASGKSGEYLMRFDTAGLLTRKWGSWSRRS